MGQDTFVLKKHCSHCLEKKIKENIRYYHNVIDVKLLTNNGFAFSIDNEMIGNEGERIKKQDCELKAFYRLQKRIKEKFPRLEIVLVLDSLYANKEVMKICKDNGWKYIITLKEGSLPTVWEEYNSLKGLQKENIKEVKVKGKLIRYRWVKEVGHYGKVFDVIEQEEVSKDGKETKFVWITNFSVDKYNVEEISKGGRIRWK